MRITIYHHSLRRSMTITSEDRRGLIRKSMDTVWTVDVNACKRLDILWCPLPTEWCMLSYLEFLTWITCGNDNASTQAWSCGGIRKQVPSNFPLARVRSHPRPGVCLLQISATAKWSGEENQQDPTTPPSNRCQRRFRATRLVRHFTRRSTHCAGGNLDICTRRKLGLTSSKDYSFSPFILLTLVLICFLYQRVRTSVDQGFCEPSNTPDSNVLITSWIFRT